MGPVTPQSLIIELEEAIASGSSERRMNTLRRVTDLFLGESDRLNDTQIGVFDDVLCRLMKRIETKALVELSGSLAPVDNAPIEVIRTLARNNEIAVAGPVLSRSPRLSTSDLVEIASSKSQQHLLAISGRSEIEEAVTDVLIDRGDRQVIHRVAGNSGARLSKTGVTVLVRNAESDENLAERIGGRPDVPAPLIHDLLLKATETVRARLLAQTPAESRSNVQRVLEKISKDLGRDTVVARDFVPAQRGILQMKREGRLTEAALLEFAERRLYEQTVAALSMMSSAPIELISTLMQKERSSGLLIPCKAAGLEWPTVSAILVSRLAHHTMSEGDLAQARDDYYRLSRSSAQRILRFWQIRATASNEPSAAAG
ncbi:MAG TPA: DUF2336 domain-containing protein [Xanthobacteraceae bacterium]|nr:DUF2336 domain-containing protein [Xanthobacteraceae bacterium]